MIGEPTAATGDPIPEDRPPVHPLSLLAVLQQEFHELHADDPSLPAGEPPRSLVELYQRIHALPVPQTALCLSGGGIRSASFALGVLQALASYGLLKHFHYLSTVSGGGYIGSWLSAWRFHERDDEAVFSALAERSGDPKAPNNPFAEPVELQQLRANSNFLTPRIGLLSADTWTAIALYTRNFLLNWLIFGPLFLGVLLIPHASFDVLIWFNNTFGSVNWTVLAIAGLLLLAGLAMSVAGRPARDQTTGSAVPERPVAPGERWFVLSILLPVYLAAGFLATFAAWLPTTPEAIRWGILLAREQGRELFYPIIYPIAFGALLYAAAWVVGYFVGGGRLRQLFRIHGARRDPVPPLAEMICYSVSGAAAGAVGAIGIALYQHLSGGAENADASQLLSFLFGGYNRIYMIIAAGVAWAMLAVLSADLLFTGLTSYHRSGDADREWSGRAAGFMAAAAIGWLAFSAIVLYGPPASAAILAMVGGSAGLVTLALGNSAKTAATFARRATERFSITTILSISTLIFILALAILLSKLGRAGLDVAAAAMDAQEDTAVKAGIATGASIVLVGISVLASYWINVNRFSLHAVYRNRLIRAFLGAARASRRRAEATRSNPDPLTGFDQADNLPMTSLWQPGGNQGRRRLFHVVNTALNVVASTNLAWQERKAESFVMTPLACGNPFVNFVPTRFYGDRRSGVTLGTAMAISGAAVSPNQGYHSSPIIGLLLMLFNVRLGWWLGNPRSGPKFYRREGPLLSIRPVLDELAGRTTDTGRYVYLSDGGHFDNLGLYEMVRRRCHFIFVSDAGADPGGALEDLGNAVRKIWIDLGVRIEFGRIDLMPRQKPPIDGAYCALGKIHYPEAGAKVGTLVYVKPGFHGKRASRYPRIRHSARGISPREHCRSVVQRIADGKLPRARQVYHRQDVQARRCGGDRRGRAARYRQVHLLSDPISRKHAAAAPDRSTAGTRRWPKHRAQMRSAASQEAWLMLGGAFAAFTVSAGIIHSYAVFLVAFIEEFRWSRAETSIAYSVSQLVAGGSSPLVGAMVDRLGPRRLLTIGGGLLFVGLLASASISSLWQNILLYGIVMTVGANCLGLVVFVPQLSRRFERRRGMAISIVQPANGFGRAASAPLVQLSI